MLEWRPFEWKEREREKRRERQKCFETTPNMLFACVILHKQFQISPLCASESDLNAMYCTKKEMIFNEANFVPRIKLMFMSCVSTSTASDESTTLWHNIYSIVISKKKTKNICIWNNWISLIKIPHTSIIHSATMRLIFGVISQCMLL